MINRNTIRALSLEPVTRNSCYDFYVKINSEYENSGSIEESISWWQDDSKKLNTLWWVLNYYSDRLDPDRHLRAVVEHRLDDLAMRKFEPLQV